MNRFILIAQSFEQLGNYNSLMGVLGGFHLWCISRLRKVFTVRLASTACVDRTNLYQSEKKYLMLLTHLEHVMSPSSNYGHYRRLLSKRKELLKDDIPTLPYIGLFLKDFTFIGAHILPTKTASHALNRGRKPRRI